MLVFENDSENPLLGSSTFFDLRLKTKLDTPNQINAWINPPRIESAGVATVPAAAITAPTPNPINAQKSGFPSFIYFPESSWLIFTNQAATEAVITPIREIPTSIRPTASTRPLVVIGNLSP